MRLISGAMSAAGGSCGTSSDLKSKKSATRAIETCAVRDLRCSSQVTRCCSWHRLVLGRCAATKQTSCGTHCYRTENLLIGEKRCIEWATLISNWCMRLTKTWHCTQTAWMGFLRSIIHVLEESFCSVYLGVQSGTNVTGTIEFGGMLLIVSMIRLKTTFDSWNKRKTPLKTGCRNEEKGDLRAPCQLLYWQRFSYE
jgi:hypothetical protein